MRGGFLLLLAFVGVIVMASSTFIAAMSSTTMMASGVECEPAGDPSLTPVNLDQEQESTARKILAVGQALQVPTRGLVVSIATALQESQIRPLTYGHATSLGPFQQQEWWGTAEERIDPTVSAQRFFQGSPNGDPGLDDIKGWERMTIAQAAQAVQKSAFPDAYAKHENHARAIVYKLAGVFDDCAPGGGKPGQMLPGVDCKPSGHIAERGLTPAALAVLRCSNQYHGANISTFYGVGKRGNKSDHPAGRAVDAMIRDYKSSAGREAGWALAQDMRKNHKKLRVKYVIFADRIWSEKRDQEGWRHYRHPSGRTDDTSAHRDHVHVSVWP